MKRPQNQLVGWMAAGLAAGFALTMGIELGPQRAAVAFPPGGGGGGNGGISAVLEALASVQLRLDGIEGAVDGLQTDIDDMQIQVDSIEGLVTPGPELKATICFKAGGEGGIEFECKLGGDAKVEASAGADVEGNGVTVEAKADGRCEAKVAGEGKAGLEAQFCFEIPIPLSVGASSGAQLLAALESAGEQVREQLPAVAGQLGWSPQELESKVMAALDQLVNQDMGVDPMSALVDLPDQLPVLAEHFPINDQLKLRVEQIGDLVPTSPSQVDVCDPDFIYVVPPALAPLVDEICLRRAELDAIFDDLIAATNTLPSMNGTVNSIKNTVNSIDDTVDNILCIVDPGCPVRPVRRAN